MPEEKRTPIGFHARLAALRGCLVEMDLHPSSEVLGRGNDHIRALEQAHDALVEALEEAKRWMPGWGSGTPDSRGAVCETAYDAHAMVQAALKLAKEGE